MKHATNLNNPDPFNRSNAVMTQSEVAQALGISQSRVDQIERRAIKKLRRLLDRRDFL